MQRRQHPAWRLLAVDSAPLVASPLHRVFVVPNVRVMAQSSLVLSLEDTLHGLREQLGSQAFPKTAQACVNDWAANDKDWLRNFYLNGGSETSPQTRMAELHKQRGATDVEIVRVLESAMALLDDTALKDRFQQFTGLAHELLSDFREVEHNFRALDRTVLQRPCAHLISCRSMKEARG